MKGLAQCALALTLAVTVIGCHQARTTDGPGSPENGDELAPPALSRFSFTQVAMGCQVRIELFAVDEQRAVELARAGFGSVESLDLILSDYIPSSELRSVERRWSTPQRVSLQLHDALCEARLVSQATMGAFDVTTGSLSLLWRDGRRRQTEPSREVLAEAAAASGWKHLSLTDSPPTLACSSPGLHLDFGGIGKGLAAQAALRAIRAAGCSQALVAVAGDIACGDAPPGKPGWTVRVDQGDASAEGSLLTLANLCVSTSGDTFQHLDTAGVRHSHIFDPATGEAVTTRRFVTVISSSGAQADAIATALSVGGCALLERLSCQPLGLLPFDARIISETNEPPAHAAECSTPSWADHASR